MRISVLGLGWFGEPLARVLIDDGHEVKGSTRSQAKKEKIEGAKLKVSILDFPTPPQSSLLDADIIILNIPPFTEALSWIKSWPWNFKTWIIFISSTSKKEILLEQEEWIKSNFTDWTILRFGGLIGNDRHPSKYLAGKKNLPGRFWPVKLLPLDEAISFTKKIIFDKTKHQILDVYIETNLNREEYYLKYCREHNMELPSFDQEDNSTFRKN